ncbi:hypothetical protein DL96DRAFT_1616754 [Flagelloscypha sp. PMI_526]|nr:hypothetical protein DL96DRAFT_1616754 [Flagelloscypha sp. PMI_526]
MPVLERLSVLTGFVSNRTRYTPTTEQKLADSPEFQRLASSNDPPSPAEHRDLRLLLRQAYLELRDLNSRVREAFGQDSHYNGLKKRRDTLESCIDTHKKIIAPIRRLPAEILSNIFAMCDTGKNSFDNSEFPLLPLFVCKRWRDVAKNNPALWTHIVVRVADLYREGCNRRLVQHLQYSRITFLHISIEGDSWMPLHADDWVTKDAFRTLMWVARRWRTVKLPITSNAGPLLRDLRGKLESLRVATIGLPDRLSHLNDWQPVYGLDAFEFAPRLHTLKLLNYVPISRFGLPRLPPDAKYKHQLHTFSTVERLDAPSMRDIFQYLPGIQTFQTTLSPPLPGSPDLHAVNFRFPAANLRHLILHQVDSLGLGNRCTLEALANSDLPRLHTLTMPFTEKYAAPLQRFIYKVRKTLRVLELHPMPHFEDSMISGACIVNVISSAKYLKELYIFEENGATLVVPMMLSLLNTPNRMTGETPLVYLDVVFLISDYSRSQDAFLTFLRGRCLSTPEFGPPIQGGLAGHIVRPRLTPGRVSKVGLGFTEDVDAEQQAVIVRTVRGFNLLGVEARAGMYVNGEKGRGGTPNVVDISGNEEREKRKVVVDTQDLACYL